MDKYFELLYWRELIGWSLFAAIFVIYAVMWIWYKLKERKK